MNLSPFPDFRFSWPLTVVDGTEDCHRPLAHRSTSLESLDKDKPPAKTKREPRASGTDPLFVEKRIRLASTPGYSVVSVSEAKTQSYIY